jgi:predicted naringenin-chalcone synthase
MQASILALSTAVPPYAFTQDESAEKMIEVLSLDQTMARKIRNLYRYTAIDRRHTVIADFKKERDAWHFWGSEYPKIVPGMTKRNECYKQEAPKLAYQAASKALELWGGDPKAITHVISISCTGAVCPGIEFLLVDSLGLKRSVNRLGINLMGCFGAFKGLAVAQSFAKEEPSNRILLVCTELCSLHLQTDFSKDTLVGNSIFSDGSAAAIIGANPSSKESSLFEIFNQFSFCLENSSEHMSWEASDHGFLIRLSSDVPRLISPHMESFSQNLLGSSISPHACNWAIHPGGKAIIQTIEKALNLENSQTQASWKILSQYGNMSSATILFVLNEICQQPSVRTWSAAIGFGPGLSVEGLLLKDSRGER